MDGWMFGRRGSARSRISAWTSRQRQRCLNGAGRSGGAGGPTITVDQAYDLLSRFYVNLPQSELADRNRQFYHLELAYWYFLDHMSGLRPEVVRTRAGSTAFFADFAAQLLSFATALAGTVISPLATTNTPIAAPDSSGHGHLPSAPVTAAGASSSDPAGAAIGMANGANCGSHLSPEAIASAYHRYLFDYKYQIPVAGCVVLARQTTPRAKTALRTTEEKSPANPVDPPSVAATAAAATAAATAATVATSVAATTRPGPAAAAAASAAAGGDGCWYAVMVKGVTTPNWGFPKGKVNRGERHEDAAARETFEEVGIAVAPPSNHPGWPAVRGRYFPVTEGVSLDVPLHTHCRGEIECVRWVPVLPISELNARGIRLTHVASIVWPRVIEYVRALDDTRFPPEQKSPPSPP